MQIKKEIYIALNILNNKGYEAYLVGGAVRNYLLKKAITDYDITTNADSNMIKMLFSDYKTYDIGKDLGTIVVIINHIKIDITPYRKESTYINHRRPKIIEVATSLKQDLERRDFTINSLCIDKDNNIIDLFDGINDLNNKQIKAIGNPAKRFNEDALRILRAIRFKTKLNFSIEENTNKQLFKNKDLLTYISNERKKDEFLQILAHKNAFKVINEYLEIFNTFINIKPITRKINNFSNPLFSLAYIISNNENNNLKQLKYSKQEINLINALVHISKINPNNDYEFITSLSDIYQKEILQYLCELHHKDYSQKYNQLKKYMITINELKITGIELISYGYEGKQIGKIKNILLEQIHRQNLTNTKSAINNYLKKHI